MPERSLTDLDFTEQLRSLLKLPADADLDFVSDPSKRQGCTPAWLHRPMPPAEKRDAVLAYCGGESASSIAGRLKRSRTTVVNLLKTVKGYLSPRERDPRKIEEWRGRISEFLASKEIERWYAEWLSAWRKRKVIGAIVKDAEEAL